MAMRKATVGALFAIALIGMMVSALGALVVTRTLPSSGSITAIGVGVYSNSACTTALPSIGWGTVNSGSSTPYTIYVKNTGNAVETLSMNTSAWSPSSASSYITLTWNQTGTQLAVGGVATALLTLTVSSSISGITSFSFNITISGTH
jgi:hypothetical protein